MILNQVVWTLMILNTKNAQQRALHQEVIPNNQKVKFCSFSRRSKDVKRQSIHYFTWIFGNEKTLFQISIAFTHGVSTATMAKLPELKLEMLPKLLCSPDWTCTEYYVPRRMVPGRTRFNKSLCYRMLKMTSYLSKRESCLSMKFMTMIKPGIEHIG